MNDRYTFGARVAISTGRVLIANFTARSADIALAQARDFARRCTDNCNVVSVEYRVNGYYGR